VVSIENQTRKPKMSHIERKTELKRRRKRQEKLGKLKAKLARAKNPGDTLAILQKIKRISPFWQQPGAAGK
jgi:hypothetical protein